MMLEKYIKNGAFDFKGLDDDLFEEEYERCSFDYHWSQDPDRDHENARAQWDRGEILEEAVLEWLENEGYHDWDRTPTNGEFVWIHNLELLMVKPDPGVVQDDVKSFDREALNDIEYASGVVCDGLFYPCKTATGVIV